MPPQGLLRLVLTECAFELVAHTISADAAKVRQVTLQQLQCAFLECESESLFVAHATEYPRGIIGEAALVKHAQQSVLKVRMPTVQVQHVAAMPSAERQAP